MRIEGACSHKDDRQKAAPAIGSSVFSHCRSSLIMRSVHQKNFLIFKIKNVMTVAEMLSRITNK